MTDLWEKFRKLNPTWERFRFLGVLKQALYSFLPVAEKLAMEYDKNDQFLVWLDSRVEPIIEINRKAQRELGGSLGCVKKIGLGIASQDPAWHNLAVAIVESIRSGPPPPLTPKMKAWLKHKYGIDAT